jgi:hypothetical protein
MRPFQGEPQAHPGSPDQDAQLPLDKFDLDGIEYCYWAFTGMACKSTTTPRPKRSGWRQQHGAHGDLMLQTDGSGVGRYYLASEESFKVMKDLRRATCSCRSSAISRAGASRGRWLHQRTRRDRVGDAPVQRRAVPDPGRHLDHFCGTPPCR